MMQHSTDVRQRKRSKLTKSTHRRQQQQSVLETVSAEKTAIDLTDSPNPTMGKSVKKCDDSRTENNVITPASEGGTLFGGCNNDGDDDYNDEAVGNANAEPNRYTIETSKADSATTTACVSLSPAPIKEKNIVASSNNQHQQERSSDNNDITAAVQVKSTTTASTKKRSFHDQILYLMLTSCKPYTLKSLAIATNSTVETLKHAMLSFIDKGLVICKEFPSKKGNDRDPKKLYWANPMSLSDVEAGSSSSSGDGSSKAGKKGNAIIKELSKLLSTSQEVHETKLERHHLECRYREVQDELKPLLAIPTMKQLDDDVTAVELELRQVQDEIEAVKNRMAANYSATSVTTSSSHKIAAATKAKQQQHHDPNTLKRKINYMLSEYKTRKRKCMDFVNELSEAMEKKVTEVVSEKVLCLDTDEAEWGIWEDGAGGGKVYGQMKNSRQQSCKTNSSREQLVVKIPSKYTV
jgi:polyhydroxyalkanoate synthesis regulator phasin